MWQIHLIWVPNLKNVTFYEWNGIFWTFRQFRVTSFSIQDGIYAHLACITCRCLENITTNFLQFHFMNPDDFSFFARALKNMLSQWFSEFWARVGRVTGTKHFCHGLRSKKSQLHDIHTMFRCQDKGKNRKKIIDLSYRGQIFKIMKNQSMKMASNKSDWRAHSI